MTRYMTIVGALLAVSAGDAGSPTLEAAETAAIESAQLWLKMIDAGNYAESWNEAAEGFRAALKKEQWPQMLTSVRKPLGKVVSRKVLAKNYTESLPNAPNGKYVVIQFDTAFENKKAVETVTPHSRRTASGGCRATTSSNQSVRFRNLAELDRE